MSLNGTQQMPLLHFFFTEGDSCGSLQLRIISCVNEYCTQLVPMTGLHMETLEIQFTVPKVATHIYSIDSHKCVQV